MCADRELSLLCFAQAASAAHESITALSELDEQHDADHTEGIAEQDAQDTLAARKAHVALLARDVYLVLSGRERNTTALEHNAQLAHRDAEAHQLTTRKMCRLVW